MPAIDSDLFQVLALALLFLTLITLLAALSVLNGIKKELTGGARSAAPAPVPSASSSSYDYSPTPVAYEPSYVAPAATPEVSTGFVSMADAATPAASAPAATAAGLRGDEPEEQPFERDGRWWFKRGGELLVYDEGTGQWIASPGSATAAVDTGSTQSFPTTTATATDAGEGWKCSSCGAVNGSTATSCRMCFAPR